MYSKEVHKYQRTTSERTGSSSPALFTPTLTNVFPFLLSLVLSLLFTFHKHLSSFNNFNSQPDSHNGYHHIHPPCLRAR
jgi:hypothetical protein